MPDRLFLVTTDADTTKMKGKTLMDELERAEQVYHCRYVDKLIVRSPWVMTQEYLDEHEIDFVIHGDDNSFDENGKDAYAFIKSIGKYKELQRTDGISTTDLITRVLKDYHGYISRCMRRGFTHTDLNIPDNVWVRRQRANFGPAGLFRSSLRLFLTSSPFDSLYYSQAELQQYVKVEKKYGA